MVSGCPCGRVVREVDIHNPLTPWTVFLSVQQLTSSVQLRNATASSFSLINCSRQCRHADWCRQHKFSATVQTGADSTGFLLLLFGQLYVLGEQKASAKKSWRPAEGQQRPTYNPGLKEKRDKWTSLQIFVYVWPISCLANEKSELSCPFPQLEWESLIREKEFAVGRVGCLCCTVFRASASLYHPVCVCVRERESESVCVCTREREKVCVCVCVCMSVYVC